MSKNPKEFKFAETPEPSKLSALKPTPSPSPHQTLPPLARRQAKVDWTDVMKRRQASVDIGEADDTSSFFYEKAFESPHRASHQRFYSKRSTEATRSELPSTETPMPIHKHRFKRRANQSLDFGDSSFSPRLVFSGSLLDHIDEAEHRLHNDADKAETIEKLRTEQQVWTEIYAELDSVVNSQERAVAARRVAHNTQKLLSRAIGLHEQHFTYCTKHIEEMQRTMRILKREVMLALKLKEALVMKSSDKERLRKEIEEMYDHSEDFNYEAFTSSARKLLDRGESQLTFFLLDAYNELAKDRSLPDTEIPQLTLGSLSRWEQELRMKFM
jgi:hypothetical protein